ARRISGATGMQSLRRPGTLDDSEQSLHADVDAVVVGAAPFVDRVTRSRPDVEGLEPPRETAAVTQAGPDTLFAREAFSWLAERDVPFPVGEEIARAILAHVHFIERHEEFDAVPETDGG